MPEVSRTIGRFLRQFKNAQDQVNKVIREEVYDPLKDLEPLVNPFTAKSDDKKGSITQSDKTVVFSEEPADNDAPSLESLQAAIHDDARQRQIRVNETDQNTAKLKTDDFASRRARLEARVLAQESSDQGHAEADSDSRTIPADLKVDAALEQNCGEEN
jgi:Sec-independent protein translocase protein TatA